MSKSYYKVLQDPKIVDACFLGEPLTAQGELIEAREFIYGEPYLGAPPALVPITHKGRILQFNFGAFGMPVVSDRIVDAISTIPPRGVKVFPVQISGKAGKFFILNVENLVPCFDERMSVFSTWKEEDERPENVGHPRMVIKLAVDANKCGTADMLRIQHWYPPLIVSDNIKKLLENIRGVGVVFEKCS